MVAVDSVRGQESDGDRDQVNSSLMISKEEDYFPKIHVIGGLNHIRPVVNHCLTVVVNRESSFF
jgi:hypothetical protein